MVTALLGFLGVMITLGANAWLARISDEKRARAEAVARTNNLRVFRVALLAQIENLQEVIDGEILFLSSNDFTWIPLLDYFSLYRDNLARLGELTEAEVEALSGIYYEYQERSLYIARKGGLASGAVPAGTGVRFDFKGDRRRKADVVSDLEAVSDMASKAAYSLKVALGRCDRQGCRSSR